MTSFLHKLQTVGQHCWKV